MGVLNGQQQHRYQVCKDEDCERFPCRVYKEGYANGREDGYQAGWLDGYSAGYGAGFSAGYAAGVAAASK